MNTLILKEKTYRYCLYPNTKTDQYCLFLLGALQDIESVESISTKFSKSINCITVEIPGTGRAEEISLTTSIRDQAFMLLDFIHQMKIKRAHLIGFSYATAIAIELCDIWNHVASVSTFGGVPGIPDSGRQATKKMIAASTRSIGEFAEVFTYSLVTKHPNIPRNKAVAKATQKAVANLPQSRIDTFFENSIRLLVHEPTHLHNIKVPCMICTGEFDPYATVNIVQHFSEQLPNANFVALPNTDHMAHLEKPDDVVLLMTALAASDVHTKIQTKQLTN